MDLSFLRGYAYRFAILRLSVADADRANRNDRGVLLVKGVVVAASLAVVFVLRDLTQPLASRPTRVTAEYARIVSGMDETEVQQILGPGEVVTDRKRLAALQATPQVEQDIRPPAEEGMIWRIWIDPDNADRWIAIKCLRIVVVRHEDRVVAAKRKHGL
jgi:hypothetical protein